jgi:hypothetical protein
MITLESFRQSTSIGYATGSLSTEDLHNNGFKIDDENNISSQPPPPKYDDIMKQAQANPKTSSNSMNEDNEELPTSSSVIVPLVHSHNHQPPSYTSTIIKMI